MWLLVSLRADECVLPVKEVEEGEERRVGGEEVEEGVPDLGEEREEVLQCKKNERGELDRVREGRGRLRSRPELPKPPW